MLRAYHQLKDPSARNSDDLRTYDMTQINESKHIPDYRKPDLTKIHRLLSRAEEQDSTMTELQFRTELEAIQHNLKLGWSSIAVHSACTIFSVGLYARYYSYTDSYSLLFELVGYVLQQTRDRKMRLSAALSGLFRLEGGEAVYKWNDTKSEIDKYVLRLGAINRYLNGETDVIPEFDESVLAKSSGDDEFKLESCLQTTFQF